MTCGLRPSSKSPKRIEWSLTGSFRGRGVEFSGVVISRFEDGRIAEDWAFSDTIEVAKQLGPWRSLLVAIREWRSFLGRD
jgi:hypothetical protein